TTDPRYAASDWAAFASKTLYNVANYLVRRSFIDERVYLNYAAIFHLVKDHEAYGALPRNVKYEVLYQLDSNWHALFAAHAAYQANPPKFLGRPRLPRYKDKQQGCNLQIQDLQDINLTGLRRGEVIPSQLGISLRTKQAAIKQVSIVLRKGCYMVEVV